MCDRNKCDCIVGTIDLIPLDSTNINDVVSIEVRKSKPKLALAIVSFKINGVAAIGDNKVWRVIPNDVCPKCYAMIDWPQILRAICKEAGFLPDLSMADQRCECCKQPAAPGEELTKVRRIVDRYLCDDCLHGHKKSNAINAVVSVTRTTSEKGVAI